LGGEAPPANGTTGEQTDGGTLESPQRDKGTLADRIRALQTSASRVAPN
jgi:hypothetical protein